MSKTITGKLENIERMPSSLNGNPRYSFTVDGYRVVLPVDSSWGYSITNYRDQIVTVEVTDKRFQLISLDEVGQFTVEEDQLGGWEKWTYESGSDAEVIVRFKTREEAQAEIDDLIDSVKAAVAAGDMTDEYDPENYRIVEA